MAEEKNIYIELMEDLIGSINPSHLVKDYKKQLDESLSLFNADIDEANTDYRFYAGPRTDYEGLILEPCPICYAGTLEKKFNIICLGINPFFDNEKKLKNKEVREFTCKDTSWQRLADFNCPSNEKEMSSSIFEHIVENAFNGSKYHGYMFRLYLALTHKDKVFDTWGQVKDEAMKYAENKYGRALKSKATEYLKELFMEEYLNNPVLFAEMIPYKSKKYQGVKMERLLEDDGYRKYLARLMSFIDRNSTSDAIIIFMGNQSNVIKFLQATRGANKIIPESFDRWEDCKKMFKGTKQDTPIYFIKSDNRKVILIPFLNTRTYGRIPIASNGLVEQIMQGDIFTSI